jgi:hypothetical protein
MIDPHAFLLLLARYPAEYIARRDNSQYDSDMFSEADRSPVMMPVGKIQSRLAQRWFHLIQGNS